MLVFAPAVFLIISNFSSNGQTYINRSTVEMPAILATLILSVD